MADLTPLRELADKWQHETDVVRGEGCDPELIDTMGEFVAELRSTIAAIESANPWIPVEKGLPEPSGERWDLWDNIGFVYGCMRVASDKWIDQYSAPVSDEFVTHYRRHVPEKGPSE